MVDLRSRTIGPTRFRSLAPIGAVDTCVKGVVAAVTCLNTLLGRPIVFLSSRKTRAEITKLELQSTASSRPAWLARRAVHKRRGTKKADVPQ